MTKQHESPSQTAGPYVHIGCVPVAAGIGVYPADLGAVMRKGPTQGDAIRVSGVIHDGAGDLIKDALVEIWQADAQGRFAGQAGADPNFAGWGRAAADAQTGLFTFDTVKPGPVPWDANTDQAPHITLWIVARGINIGLQSRIYFPDDPANSDDPVLSRVPAARRPTLIATQTGPADYRFDVQLQGPDETVFFDV